MSAAVPDATELAAVLSRLEEARAALDRVAAGAETIHRSISGLEGAVHVCYRQLRLARERLQGRREEQAAETGGNGVAK